LREKSLSSCAKLAAIGPHEKVESSIPGAQQAFLHVFRRMAGDTIVERLADFREKAARAASMYGLSVLAVVFRDREIPKSWYGITGWSQLLRSIKHMLTDQNRATLGD
jgi:hypothetical protein